MNDFVTTARAAAIAWKAATDTLPDAARADGTYNGRGPYPFCLPVDHAALNLLPDARHIALDRFAVADIPWQASTDSGPTNHLLSSQVQCANALAPHVDNPDALAAIFGTVLPIDTVLPFGADTASGHDSSDHVVFEWTGTANPLGEPETGRRRGAKATSADAAIRYRSTDGATEIALIEWKYTEHYDGEALTGGEDGLARRHATYRPWWDHPDSPIRTDLVPYEDLFVDPHYQLMRLQLLAWRLEAEHALDATRVRVLYVVPAANLALAHGFHRDSLRNYATIATHHQPGTIWTGWTRLLRRPDRFAIIDSATLVTDDAPTSPEFKARYAHLANGPTPTLAPPPVTPEELRSACHQAAMVIERVFGDGGVVDQVANADDATLAAAGPVALAEARARLEELTELTRRLRADEIFEVLHGRRS